MMELLQSVTILLLGVGLIMNGIATRHLLKTVTAMRSLLLMVMVMR